MKSRLKKTLSAIVAAAMLMTMMPATAFAVESDPAADPNAVEQYTDDGQPEAEDAAAGEQTEEASAPEEETDTTERVSETNTIQNTEQGTRQSVPATQALTETKPSDATIAQNQPFSSGTGGSDNFRIPALVTLDDGTLVAAADARWDTTGDGGGLDTIVSRSFNGTEWYYTFANYLGDNGNTHNGGSTAFIDPALATDGETIYMLVDLFPAGYALNSANNQPVAAAAFDDEGRLKLTASGTSDYSYYLGDFTDGYAQIFDAGDGAVDGYTVDEYYYLYQNGEKVSNLFYADAAYQVVKTTYLYLTKSTDGGASWSVPTLLDVKEADERFYGVGPGRGIVTSDGTIMFSCYEWNGSTNSQKSSFIYSTDNGQTWKRIDNATGSTWSSENQLVELNDGTIRMFFRNGSDQICYVDATGNADAGYTWGSIVQTGVSNNSNCQISALKYSQTINGKEAILLSCPTGGSSILGTRNSGKIFVGLVNDAGTMDFSSFSSTAVTNGTFQYSCLTELNDGSIGLLYETDSGSITYTDFEIENLAQGAQIGDPDPGFVSADGTLINSLNFAATDGEKTVEFRGLSDNQYLTVTTSNEAVATAAADGSSVTVTPMGEGTATITATVQTNSRSAETGSQYELTVTVSGVDEAYTGTITRNPGGTSYVLDTDGIDSGEEYLIVYEDHALQNTNGQTSTGHRDVTVSGNEVTSVNESNDDYLLWTFEGSGDQFTIRNRNAYLRLHNSSTISTTSQICTLDGSNGSYTIYGSNRYLGFGGIFNDNFQCEWRENSAVTVSLYRKTTDDPSWSTDLSKLQEQIDAANALTEADYTTESWDVLQDAVAAAEAAAESLSSSEYSSESEAQAAQNAIDRATQTLAEAIAGLIEAPSTVELPVAVGQTVTVSVEGEMTTAPNASIATAVIDGSTMSVTGVAEGTTQVVVGTVTYNITVQNRGGNENLSLRVGEDEAIEIRQIYEGETVEWSSSDNSIAAVYKDITAEEGNAVVVGRGVGNTVITGTVKDAEGNVVAQYTWNVNVTRNYEDTDSRSVYIFIDEIENTTVYYSLNGGPLVEVTEGVVFNNETIRSNGIALCFFAAPEEGYALTYMAATNTKGEYHIVSNGNEDGTDSDFYTGRYLSDESGRPSDVLTDAEIKAMLTEAISLGCDGGMWWTRKSGDTTNISSHLTFRSQPLPTVEKEIVSITSSDGTTVSYTDGMTVDLGDRINYEITVTRPASDRMTDDQQDGTITYSNEVLTDELTNNVGISNPDMGTSTNWPRTYTYDTYVTLTLDNYDDLVEDGTITNVVDFSYSYSSYYSKGTLSASASAAADISVSAPEYVIDFGLPVSVDVSDVLGDLTIAGGNAAYGTITPNGQSFTYSPTSILQDEDFVTLHLSNGGSYGVRIYPATTVYYEEGFASMNGFVNGNTGTGNQTAEEVNNQINQYGYDGKYSAETTGPSNNSEAVSTSTGSSAEFTFTGTGVDIYTNNTTKTGAIMIRIYQGDSLKQLISVDTVMKDGDTNFTAGQSVTAYNVPAASITGMEYGTYRVVINHVKAGSDQANRTDGVKLDGYRVHGTMANDNSVNTEVYAKNNEADPTFVELRDSVLQVGLDAVAEDSQQYADQIAENIMGQVYALDSDGVNALVLSASLSDDGVTADQNAVTDLLDNGPKNEIYLKNGDSLVFSVNAENVQVGLKALNAQTSCTINGQQLNGFGTITTSTDMFYRVTPAENGMVTITNTGTGILSVTELKLFNAQSPSSITTMSVASLTNALVALGYEAAPTYADATANINLVDYTGKVLASTSLITGGEEGTDAVFTADNIKTAAEQILPSGYDFAYKDAIKDQNVTCGNTVDVNIQIGKVATLKVTYKTLLGRTKGTVTLTAVQTSSSPAHRFTAAELRAASPDNGYWTGTLVSTSVKYGSTQTRTVIGLGF